MYNDLNSKTNILIAAFRAASGNKKPLTLEEYLLARKAVIEEMSLGIWDDIPAEKNMELPKIKTVNQKSQSTTSFSPNLKSDDTALRQIIPEISVKANDQNPDQTQSGFDILHSLADPWN